MILLADMPGLSDAHLFEVATRHAEGYSAVMSEADGIFLPPAMFSDETFDALCGLTGDTGAKSVFAKLSDTAAIALRAEEARDVDTLADLMASLETRYA
jgi:xanthine dehydrogenase accessory factor